MRVRLGDVIEVPPRADGLCGHYRCQLPAEHASFPVDPADVHADVSLSGVVVETWPVLDPDDDEDDWQ